MTKNTIQLNDPIAQTLLIPLYAKAIESQAPNPIIYDQSAIDIVANLDQNLNDFGDKRSTVGSAIRCRYFDNQVRDFINQNPNAVVVNVGCGLDARCHRLDDVAKDNPFYQVDLAEVIAIRQNLIAKKTNEMLMIGSILDNDWLDTLANNHPNTPFIFIIEGVLMYFDDHVNRHFLQNIAERFDNAMICFDTVSSFCAKHSKKHPSIKHTDTHFKSSIDDPKSVENWHNKLKLVKNQPFGDFDDNKRMGVITYLMMKYVPFMHHSFKLLNYQLKN